MCEEFMWDIIKSVSAGNALFSKTLQRISGDEDIKVLLTTFAWYGKVAGGFGLPGGLSASQIEEKVSWLLKGGKFKYGELDYQNKKYNVNDPFGNQVFSDIIRQIWFNKGKADAGAFLTMLKNQQISESLLLLVVTSVEIAIKEWATGVQVKIHFSEEVVAPRYTHHKGVWNLLKVKCSSFPQYKLKSIFKAIMINAGFLFLLEINKACISELEGVDFDALESIATGSGTNNTTTNN
ncbi:hypothetical protein BDZ94DRAFT_1350304 [Collybia nuda]|uniref:DUF6532 domain-containing protein n=1 Tax=Collybia nuda TaxID=64659 RepID=A0A9P5XTI3_9AGAR|nr:hypothetical protein BDZ94DRAFT_1350304 [Collybia nuda]